jgi:hypothetical protein
VARVTPPKLGQSGGGLFQELSMRLKLVLRLMKDRRVSIFLKAIPVFAVVYLFFPDILLGPVDDGVIIWLGCYLFVELCPEYVVKEHMDALNHVVTSHWHEVPDKNEVVEGEFRNAPDDSRKMIEK